MKQRKINLIFLWLSHFWDFDIVYVEVVVLIFINHDDLRSLELMEECVRRGYYVTDQIKDIKYADVIYLGTKGIDRKNRLLTHNETLILSDDFFSLLKKGSMVITLAYNSFLEQLSKKYGFKYIYLLENKRFIYLNSILTAEGLISYLIAHRRFPLYQSRIVILGFGHCAKPIIEYLKAMHSDVYVVVRRKELQKEIESMGCHFMFIEDMDLKDFDILINTVPQLIVDKEKLDQANSQMMIVDIASYPYGVDHHYALTQGFNSIILPSIPSKYAYGYAGKMIIDEIERMLEN